MRGAKSWARSWGSLLSRYYYAGVALTSNGFISAAAAAAGVSEKERQRERETERCVYV